MVKKNNKETKSEIDGAEHKAAAVKTKGAGKAREMKEKFTPDSERRENLSAESASTFSSSESGVTSKCQRVLIRTFGWPVAGL